MKTQSGLSGACPVSLSDRWLIALEKLSQIPSNSMDYVDHASRWLASNGSVPGRRAVDLDRRPGCHRHNRLPGRQAFASRLSGPVESRLRELLRQTAPVALSCPVFRRLHWIVFICTIWAAVLIMRAADLAEPQLLPECDCEPGNRMADHLDLFQGHPQPSIANLVAVSAWTLAALNVFGLSGRHDPGARFPGAGARRGARLRIAGDQELSSSVRC